MARTRRLDIEITGDASDAKRALRDTGDEADRLDRKLNDLGKKFGSNFGKNMSAGLKSVLGGGNSSLAVTAATAFSAEFTGALAASLASGIAKVAHGLAAAFALLPAAAGAAGLAFGTLKLALSGVGDALSAGLTGDTEAFNEALKGLAPSAQSVVREIAGMKDQFDGLKGSVQESFYAPLVDSVKPLAESYLPAMNLILSDIARTFGQVTHGVASFFTMPGTTQVVTTALLDMREAVTNVALGVGSLVQAFLPLVTVGASFLPQITDGFGAATAQLAAFMNEAARTGELAAFIQGGLDKLSSLWETAKQVGGILTDIGAIGAAAFAHLGLESGGFLDTIERLVGQVRDFVESSEGSGVLAEIMGVLKDLASSLMGTLQRAGEILAPFLPQIARVVTAFANLKFAILNAIAPAVAIIGGVLLPVLASLMEWLARNKPVLQGILISLFTLWAVHAGIAAAATIAATWPLILIGVAIAALAALVIIHFDTIKQWISNVFNWVKDNWPLLLAILTGPIGMAVLLITQHWDTIKSGITAVKDWIVDRFNDVVSFVTGIPGALATAGAGMWDFIKDTFKSAINKVIGWWNNLSFPALTVGGQDPFGPFGPSLPRVTIGGWELPDIPLRLAEGGIVPRTPGGVPALLGEGRHDEAVVPLPRGANLGAGGDTYNFHFHSPVSSEREAERWVVSALNRARDKGLR